MKNHIMRKILATILMLTVAMGLLTGCGSSSTEKSSSADSDEKTVIKVGTAGTIAPFTYTDKDGNLIGYDVELLKAIFEKLPQYELKFESTEFQSITAGLDSGLYQIGACNFAYNDLRAEKYIYSDPIFENQFVIAVKNDNNEINSWEDIVGKTTEVGSGSNYATALEKWNEENPDKQVKLNYSENDLANTLGNVDSGKYDFQLIDKTTLKNYNQEFGYNLKSIDLTKEQSELIGSNPYSYYLVEKTSDGEKLAEELNGALAEIIADGTAAKISEKYFEGNYVPSAK
jgi:polar amino acid transport system substrate-binding protein